MCYHTHVVNRAPSSDAKIMITIHRVASTSKYNFAGTMYVSEAALVSFICISGLLLLLHFRKCDTHNFRISVQQELFELVGRKSRNETTFGVLVFSEHFQFLNTCHRQDRTSSLHTLFILFMVAIKQGSGFSTAITRSTWANCRYFRDARTSWKRYMYYAPWRIYAMHEIACKLAPPQLHGRT